MNVCDGTGILELQDDSGYTFQAYCKGCEACQKPSDAQPGPQTVQVSLETLRDLEAALDAVAGRQMTLGLTSADSMGLILAYLPALIEMSRQWMLEHSKDEHEVSTSAHPLYGSGL